MSMRHPTFSEAEAEMSTHEQDTRSQRFDRFPPPFDLRLHAGHQGVARVPGAGIAGDVFHAVYIRTVLNPHLWQEDKRTISRFSA